jgi:glycerate 2-kinase
MFQNSVLKRNGKMGEDACEIMAAAIQAVDPYQCIKDRLLYESGILKIDRQVINLDAYERIFLIGFGKASVPMAEAVIDILGSRLVSASVVAKEASFLAEDGYKQLLKVYLGEHPIPGDGSIQSTRAVLASLPELTSRDLVLVVISGGGSALFTDPVQGISLETMQQMTDTLLRCGADIYEINTLRKHLDQVKGGRLAQRLQPAAVNSLILSDVIGDSLEMIASGPTVPDSTTYHDALDVINRYNLRDVLPPSIMNIIDEGVKGLLPETLKTGIIQPDGLGNYLVGSNQKAASAAGEKAISLGYNSEVISTSLTGLTEDIAVYFGEIIEAEQVENRPVEKPACLIFGGEPTVRVVGSGKGGRNQDLVLRMVPRLSEREDVLFISLATDGEDGPTDAAGAASDSSVYREGTVVKGLIVSTFIDTSNAYQYLDETDALIRVGSTGTNVNDLILIFFDNQTR